MNFKIHQVQSFELPETMTVRQEQTGNSQSQDVMVYSDLKNDNQEQSEQKDNLYFRRYDRLIEARNFQCAEFQKWSMYFMIAIGALFVGFYSLWAPEKDYTHQLFLPFLVACTGYVFSICWHWSNKGYYFWMKNWINLIMDAEKDFASSEAVYSVMKKKDSDFCEYLCFKSDANVSTSKVVIMLSFVTMIIWGVLVLFCIREKIDIEYLKDSVTFLIVAFVLSFVISLIVNAGAKLFKSDISNHK